MLVLAVAPILPAMSAGAAPPPGTPVLRQSAELVAQPLGTEGRPDTDVALSADGSTLAVAGREAVVVYVRSGDSWLTQTTLGPPTTEGMVRDAWPSAIAISADGDTLAVTDPSATVRIDDNNSILYAGVVDLFTRSGRTWRAAGQLDAPHREDFGGFGNDVSLSGDGTRVAVSNIHDNTNRTQAYIADTGNRVVRELPPPAGSKNGWHSVAISPDGKTVVVGAPNGGVRPRRGGVSVLLDDPVKGWVQRWYIEAQPGKDDSNFGTAVAVTDTDTVVVGAPYRREVSVFDRRGAALVRTARFTPQYKTQASGLGNNVAVSADGSTVVAGARDRSMAGGSITAAGAGYRWVRSAGGWSWAGLLTMAHPDAYDSLGSSTAVSGDGRVVVLGAPYRADTGAAIVFSAVPGSG